MKSMSLVIFGFSPVHQQAQLGSLFSHDSLIQSKDMEQLSEQGHINHQHNKGL